jgi:hypothetical protein
MGTLHKDQHAFFIISHSVLLRTRNISNKSVKKIKTHILGSTLFFENIALFEKIWKKYCRVGQATDDNMVHAHCMTDN